MIHTLVQTWLTDLADTPAGKALLPVLVFAYSNTVMRT